MVLLPDTERASVPARVLIFFSQDYIRYISSKLCLDLHPVIPVEESVTSFLTTLSQASPSEVLSDQETKRTFSLQQLTASKRNTTSSTRKPRASRRQRERSYSSSKDSFFNKRDQSTVLATKYRIHQPTQGIGSGLGDIWRKASMQQTSQRLDQEQGAENRNRPGYYCDQFL